MTQTQISKRLLAIMASGALLLAGCSDTSGNAGAATELTSASTADGTATNTEPAAPDPDAIDAADMSTATPPADSDADGDGDPGDVTDDPGDAILSGGDHVTWQLGEPISYYSYANLSTDDAQRVTIESFEYIDKADIPDAETAQRAVDGELVLHVKWEHLLGDVQANDGYIVVYAGGGDAAASIVWYRDDNIPNGGVEPGEPAVGTFSYLVDRGPTTVVLVDYMDKPVAELQLDTSR